MVLDSDVIIRLLTADDPERSTRFRKFLSSARNLILTDVTFAEVYWTLSSFYRFEKAKIISSLEILIHDRAIECNIDLLEKTLFILQQTNISLIDAYTAAYALLKSDARVVSFDRGFDKLTDIQRVVL